MALPGHGGSPGLVPRDGGGFDEVVSGFINSLDAIEVEQTALVAYSMGARVAMHVAAAHPERVTHLVVIGGHPGLDKAQQRQGRLLLDRKRASLLRGSGLGPFLDTWYRQDLFSGFRRCPEFERIVADRSVGDVDGIATTLERLSLGHQEPLTEAMVASKIPTLWIAGSEDTRYVETLAPIAEAQAAGQFRVIEGAGHALVSEAPEALTEALDAFFA